MPADTMIIYVFLRHSVTDYVGIWRVSSQTSCIAYHNVHCLFTASGSRLCSPLAEQSLSYSWCSHRFCSVSVSSTMWIMLYRTLVPIFHFFLADIVGHSPAHLRLLAHRHSGGLGWRRRATHVPGHWFKVARRTLIAFAAYVRHVNGNEASPLDTLQLVFRHSYISALSRRCWPLSWSSKYT